MKLTYRAIAVGLMAAGLTFGSGLTGLSATAQAQSHSPASQKSSESHVYLIRFAEPGLLYFEGDSAGLRATSPQATGSRKLDVTSSASVAYSAHLNDALAQHLDSIQGALGRAVTPKFHYTVTHHGIALELTAQEAAALATVPQVAHIAQEEIWEVDTHRSAYFVGADTIWDGSNVPGGTGTRGQGITIGVFDTGANQDHPSFAPMGAECGFSTPEPKLIAKDCSATGCVGGNPEDTNGHGSHTASTAGGNQVPLTATPAPQRPITGIAPCAKLITYLVCPGGSCPNSAITNAINQAIVDGIDVANFSLGPNVNGQPNPWNPGDTVRLTLDMMQADIAVAMSAGNTRTAPTQPTQPVAEVKNIGPWVITVANSGHDAVAAGPGQAGVTAPTPVPVALQNFTIQGVDTPPPAVISAPVLDFPANQLLCSAGAQPPAGYYNGKIAAIARGTCNFSEKVANAAAAGATTVVLYNNAAGDLTNIATSAPNGVSVVTATQAVGNEIVSFIASSATDVILNIHTPPRSAAGVLSGGSLRGPNMFADFTKPDITAPGTGIYAAYRDPENYANSSGTSMSGPQVAGGLALIRAVHPTWTPMEAISALMLAAKREDQTMPDTVTPANPDGVGSGMLELRDAARAGFVLDESVANFIAANPGSGGNPRTLNLPAVRHTSCNGAGCSWTRTVSSTLSTSATWTASVVQPTGFTVTVSPSTFTLGAGADQVVTITAVPNAGEPGTAIRYGYIDFASASSPTLHFTVAVQGVGGVAGGDADLMLSLTALPDPVANGGTVNYVANVANLGPDAATGVVAEFDLPAGSTFDGFSLLAGELQADAGVSLAGDKGTAGQRGAGSWNCGAVGTAVTCEYTGTINASSMATPLSLQTTINSPVIGTVEATGVVSADQTDPNTANNEVTVDFEVTGVTDLIFANGFEDDTPAGPICVDVTGSVGNGASGNASNTVILLNIGVGNEVTGVAADITVEAFSPSWLSEAQVTYGSTSATQIQLTPAGGTTPIDNPGVHDYTTGGVISLAAIPLPNITVDADGILKLEFRETFDDTSINPDSEWSNLEPAAVCPGLYLECTNQAACDAAVAAHNGSL